MNKAEETQLGILNKFWFDTYGQLKKKITDLEQWNSQQRDRIETLEEKVQFLKGKLDYLYDIKEIC